MNKSFVIYYPNPYSIFVQFNASRLNKKAKRKMCNFRSLLSVNKEKQYISVHIMFVPSCSIIVFSVPAETFAEKFYLKICL